MLTAISLVLLGLQGPTQDLSTVQRKLEESVLVLTDRFSIRRVEDEQRAVLAYDRNRGTFTVTVSRDLLDINGELPGKRENYLRGTRYERGHWRCDVTRDHFAAILDQARGVRDLVPTRDLGWVKGRRTHAGLRLLHRDVDWQNPYPTRAPCLVGVYEHPEQAARFAEITESLWARIDALPLEKLDAPDAPTYVRLPNRKLPALRIATRRAQHEPFAAELDLNRTTVTAQGRSKWSISIPFRGRTDRSYSVLVNLGASPIVVDAVLR